MSESRPDYTKFMKKSSSPEIGRSSQERDQISQREPNHREEDIPWAEIIVEPEHSPELKSTSVILNREHGAHRLKTAHGHKANSVSAIEPFVGLNGPSLIPDTALDYSVDADFSSRMSLFSAPSPVGAAPPIAVLVVVALVVFFFLFQ
jgi:hypothetical protein